MTYQDLPSLYIGKQNRGNRSNHARRNWTPGQKAFVTGGLGSHNLRGLGDGAGSIPWQTDVLPEQMESSRQLSGVQALMLAVLEDAIELIQGHGLKLKRDRESAEVWIGSDREDFVFSFVNVCVALGLDAGYVRAGLRGERRKAA